MPPVWLSTITVGPFTAGPNETLQTRTLNVASLADRFQVPSSCLNDLWYDWHSTGQVWEPELRLAPLNHENCYPPAFNNYTSLLYFPGVCPEGYTFNPTQLQTAGNPVTTLATCCPQGYQVLNKCSKFLVTSGGQPLTITVTASLSAAQYRLKTESQAYRTVTVSRSLLPRQIPSIATPTPTAPPSLEAQTMIFTSQITAAASVYAEPITVAWRSADTEFARIMERIGNMNGTWNQSAAPRPSGPTSQPRKSPERGAIAGIVIGILAAVGVTAGIVLLWRWKNAGKQVMRKSITSDGGSRWEKAELEAKPKGMPPELDGGDVAELDARDLAELDDRNIAELQDTQAPVELPGKDKVFVKVGTPEP